jgi:hypothetical protein
MKLREFLGTYSVLFNPADIVEYLHQSLWWMCSLWLKSVIGAGCLTRGCRLMQKRFCICGQLAAILS